jgi:hypothetical protein
MIAPALRYLWQRHKVLLLLLLLLLPQALKTMGHDEGDRNFGVEVPMEQQAQVWHNRCGAQIVKHPG